MLRSFTVANHKSIKDEQELSLLPAYAKDRPVVPVAAIFGANASGKSNLLDSMAWLKSAVLDSFGRWQPGSGVPRTRFRLEPESEQRPTAFEVDLVLDGVRYVYRLAADSEAVLEEQLTSYPNGRPRAIFRRNGEELSFGSTVPEGRSLTTVLSRLTRDNALFLSVAAANDVAEVQRVYQWFRVGCAVGTAPNAVLPERALAERLAGPGGVLIEDFIKAADLGIRRIEVASRADQPAERLTHVGPFEFAWVPGGGGAESFRVQHSRTTVLDEYHGGQRVVFRHGPGETPFALIDQSAGTRSWIGLVCQALDVIDAGGVLLVDEVDASLHPHLTARLVNLFRDEETNPRLAQLIFTTHDATLLDDEVLSRDEIWFMEKDAETGASRLYPLTDFHPRKNENTEGRYLAGSYGAVPRLADHRFRTALKRGKRTDAA